MYSFGKKIPQDVPEGQYPDINKYLLENPLKVDDLRSYLPNLIADVNQLSRDVKCAFCYYMQDGHLVMNKMMYDHTSNDTILRYISKDKKEENGNLINLIIQNMGRYEFPKHMVRLFRTDVDYRISGSRLLSQLQQGEELDLKSFISTTISNIPTNPKSQSSKYGLVIMVFEFNPLTLKRAELQEIRGRYLGQIDKISYSEEEFLLAPCRIHVKEVYKKKTVLGYVIRNATFIICSVVRYL